MTKCRNFFEGLGVGTMEGACPDAHPPLTPRAYKASFLNPLHYKFLAILCINKVRHSFVIFDMNHPDIPTSMYYKIRKFSPTLQHLYVEMMASYMMSRKNAVYKQIHCVHEKLHP